MKNFKLVIILFALILLLFACGSTPDTETHYFVLNPNHSVENNSAISNNIKLQPIQLAKFLDQPGLVLQTDLHEVKVAHYHRWAEPLKTNLHRYIAQSIGIGSTDEATQTLEIHFQQFHGSQDGIAIASGYWKLNNASYPFSYTAPLTKTGYPELVKQLATLLDILVEDISSKIN